MVGARVIREKESIDERVFELASLGDAQGFVRLPYNVVVAGDPPHWFEAEAYDPKGYRGVDVRLFGSGRIEGSAFRLPVVMLPYAFTSKRAFFEGREDDPRVLSIAGGGLLVPGARSDRPQGAFSLNAPSRNVYALALSYEGGPVYLLPSDDGVARLSSPNVALDKPIRKMLDRASHSEKRAIGIEELL